MIRYIFFPLLLLITSVAVGQNIHGETPIQTVTRIYNAYVQQQTENQDIDENKDAMTRALYTLQDSADVKDFDILIKAWLGYRPPNYPIKKLVEPILYKNKVAAIERINAILIRNDTYAGRNSSPGSDLINLREKIFKHNNKNDD